VQTVKQYIPVTNDEQRQVHRDTMLASQKQSQTIVMPTQFMPSPRNPFLEAAQAERWAQQSSAENQYATRPSTTASTQRGQSRGMCPAVVDMQFPARPNTTQSLKGRPLMSRSASLSVISLKSMEPSTYEHIDLLNHPEYASSVQRTESAAPPSSPAASVISFPQNVPAKSRVTMNLPMYFPPPKLIKIHPNVRRSLQRPAGLLPSMRRLRLST